jgi:hypothetical protein
MTARHRVPILALGKAKSISAGLFMLTLSSLVRLAKIAFMMGQVPMWKVCSSALWQRRHSGPWVAGHVWRVTIPLWRIAHHNYRGIKIRCYNIRLMLISCRIQSRVVDRRRGMRMTTDRRYSLGARQWNILRSAGRAVESKVGL